MAAAPGSVNAQLLDSQRVNEALRLQFEKLKAEALREIKDRDSKNEQLEREALQARGAAQQVRDEAERARRDSAARLAKTMREVAFRESHETRNKFLASQARLGRFVARRQGPAIHEEWEEGEDYVAVRHQAAQLEVRQRELDKLKRQLAKRNKKLRGAMASSSSGAAGKGVQAKSGSARGKVKPVAAAASEGESEEEEEEDDGPIAGVAADEGLIASILRSTEGSLLFRDLESPSTPVSLASTPATSAPAHVAGTSAGQGQSRHDIFTELRLVEDEESVRVALGAVKRDLDALAKRKADLDAEKQLMAMEFRRLRAEKDSRFRGFPTLPPEGPQRDRYLLLSMLGKGGFSEVWRAMDLWDSREVAVKIHQLSPSWSEQKKSDYVKHATREYEIQKEMRHRNVVRLVEVIEMDSDTFATVLELCRGSDLDHLLKQHGTLPEREARAILLQMLSALRYLNGVSSAFDTDSGGNSSGGTAAAGAGAGAGAGGDQNAGLSSSSSSSAAAAGSDSVGQGGSGAAAAGLAVPPAARRKIIHYDLKPANILFDEFRTAKVTDFGLSKIADDGDDGSGCVSPPEGETSPNLYRHSPLFLPFSGVPACRIENTTMGAGTYWYLPPECFPGGGAGAGSGAEGGPAGGPGGPGATHAALISNKVDVWSVGVIFYQMLFGRRPLGEGMTQDHILAHNLIGRAKPSDIVFPGAPKVTSEAKAFIRRCLTPAVAERPDVLTICEDGYLRMKMR